MNKDLGDRIIVIAEAANDIMEKIAPDIFTNLNMDNPKHRIAFEASKRAFPSYWEDAEKNDYKPEALIDSINKRRLKRYEKELNRFKEKEEA